MMASLASAVSAPPEINADWEQLPWQNIAPLEIARFMGSKPAHLPLTQAKLAYDDQALYVIFRVQDRYVRAVVERYDGDGYRDADGIVIKGIPDLLKLLKQPLQHATLDGVGRHEVEDEAVFALAVAVDAPHALLQAHGIPGDVVVDHEPAELQVDALAGSLGGH